MDKNHKLLTKSLGIMEMMTVCAVFCGSWTPVCSTAWTQSTVALSALALGFDNCF